MKTKIYSKWVGLITILVLTITLSLNTPNAHASSTSILNIEALSQTSSNSCTGPKATIGTAGNTYCKCTNDHGCLDNTGCGSAQPIK